MSVITRVYFCRSLVRWSWQPESPIRCSDIYRRNQSLEVPSSKPFLPDLSCQMLLKEIHWNSSSSCFLSQLLRWRCLLWCRCHRPPQPQRHSGRSTPTPPALRCGAWENDGKPWETHRKMRVYWDLLGFNWIFHGIYLLIMINIANEHRHWKFVSFPTQNGDFHSYVGVLECNFLHCDVEDSI